MAMSHFVLETVVSTRRHGMEGRGGGFFNEGGFDRGRGGAAVILLLLFCITVSMNKEG